MAPVEYNTLALAVEGYPGRQSYLPGEEVTLHCSARTPTFAAEIARIGKERIVVWRRDQLPGREQPTPADAYAKGCGWPVTFALRIPTDWPSGFYEVTFQAHGVTGPAATSHACFVVRTAHPGRTASRLLVLSTNTYQAYNKWGGHCLYTGATQVSFQRPLERGFVTRPAAAYDGRVASIEPAGDPEHHRLLAYLKTNQYPLWCASGGWHNWERRFVQWAERNGLALDYAVNSDLELRPTVLDGYKLLLSVGHDEYWSWAMRDTIDAFVEAGGNHAIFSGNTSFWQVRLADEGQTMVCYKGQAHLKDPVMGTAEQARLTSFWSSPLIGRPESTTIGLSFTHGGYARVGGGTPRSSGAYTVYRPEHWAFAGTDLHYGDALGLGAYVVGYEVDGCALTLDNGLPVPTYTDSTPAGFTILATAPARLLSQTAAYSEIPKAIWADPDGPGDLESLAMGLFGEASPANVARLAHGHAVMGYFTRGQGTVFNVGSTDWAYGLDQDPLIQQVTKNVLEQLG
ncbi:MAG: hypothetical protein KF832_19875 [Caldilineaceae bacterium]|nr:hypothetical protein [Caldilineaceae bacterium]